MFPDVFFHFFTSLQHSPQNPCQRHQFEQMIWWRTLQQLLGREHHTCRSSQKSRSNKKTTKNKNLAKGWKYQKLVFFFVGGGEEGFRQERKPSQQGLSVGKKNRCNSKQLRVMRQGTSTAPCFAKLIIGSWNMFNSPTNSWNPFSKTHSESGPLKLS